MFIKQIFFTQQNGDVQKNTDTAFEMENQNILFSKWTLSLFVQFQELCSFCLDNSMMLIIYFLVGVNIIGVFVLHLFYTLVSTTFRHTPLILINTSLFHIMWTIYRRSQPVWIREHQLVNGFCSRVLLLMEQLVDCDCWATFSCYVSYGNRSFHEKTTTCSTYLEMCVRLFGFTSYEYYVTFHVFILFWIDD